MKRTTTKISIILLSLLMLSSIVYAVPGIPHQFYGEVNVNGNPAEDGLLITAEIDGESVAATATRDSTYGNSPYVFYIQQPDGVNREGKTITFFVDGVEAGEYTFSTGKSTNLDLGITQDVPPPADNGNSGSSGSSGGSSGGGGGVPPAPVTTEDDESDSETQEDSTNTNVVTASAAACTSDWECSDWLDCLNGQQKRVCTDRNSCDSEVDKPEEKQECSMGKVSVPTDKPIFSMITGAVIGGGVGTFIALAILVAIIALLLFFRLKGNSKPAKSKKGKR